MVESPRSPRYRLHWVVAAALTLAACGGGSGSSSGSSAPETTGSEPSPAAAGAITDKQDVVGAVVRIVASGSYRDMAEGTMAADWSGTGFIISADGLVVTNQHVVEGAGSLDVYLNGEERPRNARILGVSECNDLAVIDLEGDGYPYLEWYDGAAEPFPARRSRIHADEGQCLEGPGQREHRMGITRLHDRA